MKDKFTNHMNSDDENIARKLDRVADQTIINAQFASELEERLRTAHQPRLSWFESSFKQVPPTLRWVALAILLGLVLNWSIGSLIHAPQPGIDGTPAMPDTATPSPEIAINETATPATDDGGYDWRGSKLYLNVRFPTSPAEANISLLRDEQPASIDTARAVASQFGIQGEIFETPGRLPGTTSYLVTDGKQRLYVQSSLNYDYYADYGAYSYMSGGKNISEEQAATVIDAFMKSHGLNFEYKLEDPQINPGMYYVLPLTPDGIPVYHNYNIPERLEFTVDEKEQVVLMTSYQIKYEAAGAFGIRTAEEAFQQVLDQSDIIQNGVLEIIRSAGISKAGFWSRSYPDHETITIYAQPTSYPAAEPDGAPFISIGQYTAIGNITGIESVDSSTYIEATGQFIAENGIRKFNVDSWKITNATEAALSGNLHREGDQIILTADDGSGEYVIDEAPADLPLNTEVPDAYLAVYGFLSEGKLNWHSIQYYPAGSGGGGGGGSGTGFYQLNLSGTPVPFPSPTLQLESTQGNVEYIVKEGDTLFAIAEAYGISPEKIFQANGLSDGDILQVGMTLSIPGAQSQSQNPLIGKRFENQRGIFIVNIYRKSDGSQRKEYAFITSAENSYYNLILEGDNLQELEKYHNRPVNIWATIEKADDFGNLTAKVDRYEIPFPDLQIQIFRGSQKTEIVADQPVELFTAEDGKTYVELDPSGGIRNSILGKEGDAVIHEALAIPDETYGGYSTLRIFSSSLAENPSNDQATELTITADQPNTLDESPDSGNYVPPPLTIESVELVYYVPDPLYATPDPNAGPQYLQPAWRFYGHYRDGSEVEFLVQALQPEFLLPELAPYTGPG